MFFGIGRPSRWTWWPLSQRVIATSLLAETFMPRYGGCWCKVQHLHLRREMNAYLLNQAVEIRIKAALSFRVKNGERINQQKPPVLSPSTRKMKGFWLKCTPLIFAPRSFSPTSRTQTKDSFMWNYVVTRWTSTSVLKTTLIRFFPHYGWTALTRIQFHSNDCVVTVTLTAT